MRWPPWSAGQPRPAVADRVHRRPGRRRGPRADAAGRAVRPRSRARHPRGRSTTSTARSPAIVAAVRPGGLLSVLVGNPVAGGDRPGRSAGEPARRAGRTARARRPTSRRPGRSRCSAPRGRACCSRRCTASACSSSWSPGRRWTRPARGPTLARAWMPRRPAGAPFADIAGRVHLLARRAAGRRAWAAARTCPGPPASSTATTPAARCCTSTWTRSTPASRSEAAPSCAAGRSSSAGAPRRGGGGLLRGAPLRHPQRHADDARRCACARTRSCCRPTAPRTQRRRRR